MLRAALLTSAVLLAAQPVIDACTTFCVRAGDRTLFGRNYDFEHGDGMLMVNGAGAERKGYLPEGPEWRVAHGSVTFNQFGRGFPMGGMNEAGLVVELMWLDETRYPAADTRAPLTVLEWIQFQLDTAATVADVLASDARVRIQGRTPLHYLVADRSGASATVEFLDGKLVAHRGGALPYAALANDSYAKSLSFVESRGRKPARGGGSLERFSRAALALPSVSTSGAAAVDRAFDVLRDVAQTSTRWSIVYDQSAGVIHWRTDRHQPRRFVRMSDLSFGCGRDPLAVDLHMPLSGDARSRLAPLTHDANLALIRGSVKKTSFLRQTPESEIVADATYGFASRCRANSGSLD